VVELTDIVSEGANELFVRVNNLWNATIAPRAGEHQFNGGIYRDVSLILTDRSCVDWMGTFVKTIQLEKNNASINVQTDVLLELPNKQAVLESVIVYEGKTIATQQTTLMHQKKQAVSQQFELKEPHLWVPENPTRYQLISRVLVDGQQVDLYDTYFGIRTVRFDKDEGFFLNGEHYDIWGANVHQDHAGWGIHIAKLPFLLTISES